MRLKERVRSAAEGERASSKASWKKPRDLVGAVGLCWGYGVLRLWRIVEGLGPRWGLNALRLWGLVEALEPCRDRGVLLWMWGLFQTGGPELLAMKTMLILAFAPTDQFDDDYGHHQNVDRTYLSHSLFFLLMTPCKWIGHLDCQEEMKFHSEEHYF